MSIITIGITINIIITITVIITISSTNEQNFFFLSPMCSFFLSLPVKGLSDYTVHLDEVLVRVQSLATVFISFVICLHFPCFYALLFPYFHPFSLFRACLFVYLLHLFFPPCLSFSAFSFFLSLPFFTMSSLFLLYFPFSFSSCLSFKPS